MAILGMGLRAPIGKPVVMHGLPRLLGRLGLRGGQLRRRPLLAGMMEVNGRPLPSASQSRSRLLLLELFILLLIPRLLGVPPLPKLELVLDLFVLLTGALAADWDSGAIVPLRTMLSTLKSAAEVERFRTFVQSSKNNPDITFFVLKGESELEKARQDFTEVEWVEARVPGAWRGHLRLAASPFRALAAAARNSRGSAGRCDPSGSVTSRRDGPTGLSVLSEAVRPVFGGVSSPNDTFGLRSDRLRRSFRRSDRFVGAFGGGPTGLRRSFRRSDGGLFRWFRRGPTTLSAVRPVCSGGSGAAVAVRRHFRRSDRSVPVVPVCGRGHINWDLAHKSVATGRSRRSRRSRRIQADPRGCGPVHSSPG